MSQGGKISLAALGGEVKGRQAGDTGTSRRFRPPSRSSDESGCRSACRNGEGSFKEMERINLNPLSLKKEELKACHRPFWVWGNVDGLTSNYGVRILSHQERKVLGWLGLGIKKIQTFRR